MLLPAPSSHCCMSSSSSTTVIRQELSQLLLSNACGKPKLPAVSTLAYLTASVMVLSLAQLVSCNSCKIVRKL